ncbi:hypothetical protein R70006_04924 [Paraburkholderia domus]|uniref:hypothetical protein n=1 Tax=Paraburkholderia domus TaxID=2793075 RepID=UPI001911938E|nr:hypothetical protein [Paraburkholderia domus]MBK5051837.1 hypothetical protein [Burkholderia sp. R-70006]CAE6792774.1 hypothetical protein R70006_04924 [Paraburkholderia domus]
MTRLHAVFYTLLPLRFVVYVAGGILALWFFGTWFIAFVAQLEIWSGWIDNPLEIGGAHLHQFFMDHQTALHSGYVVIAAVLLAIAVRRYCAARRAVSNDLKWPQA